MLPTDQGALWSSEGGGLGRRPRAPSPSGTRNCAVLTQRTSPSSGSTRSSFQGHELEKEPCPATFPPRAGRRPPPRQGARSACAVLLVRRTSGAEIIQKTTFYNHRSLSGNASETPKPSRALFRKTCVGREAASQKGKGKHGGTIAGLGEQQHPGARDGASGRSQSAGNDAARGRPLLLI